MLIPHFFMLVILSLIFYLGILLNLSLLKLKGSTESTAKTYVLLIIFLLIFLGMILKFAKSKQTYKFFRHKILIGGKKSVLFINISELAKKRGVLDKMFGTYTLVLTHDAKLEFIPLSIDMESYVNQLVQYNKDQATQVY